MEETFILYSASVNGSSADGPKSIEGGGVGIKGEGGEEEEGEEHKQTTNI